MIITRGLTKRFGRITAVDDVSLDVREGDVYGFLGANGSGKTTTVRMLLGLVLATRGEVEVMGRRMPRGASRVLPEIGAMVEGPASYPNLSGRANLRLFDAMGSGGHRASRAGRIDDALDRVGLGGVDKRPVRAYSLGMRQRLGLAHALVRRPRLLVLDEPTNGLDPQGIHEIRDLLLDLNRDGTTVFVSSHLLAEIEQTCSRVGVLDEGRLVLQNEIDDLRGPTGRIAVTTSDAGAAAGLLGRGVEVLSNGAGKSGRSSVLLVRTADAAELNRRLVAGGVPVERLEPERRTLEEVVLEATRPGSDRMARR